MLDSVRLPGTLRFVNIEVFFFFVCLFWLYMVVPLIAVTILR